MSESSRFPTSAALERAEPVVTFFVASFAGWTVLAHIWVFWMHGTFATLRWTALGLGFPIALCAFYLSKLQATPLPQGREETARPLGRRLLYLAAALVILLATYVFENHHLFTWGVSALALSWAWPLAQNSFRFEAPQDSRLALGMTIAFVLGAVGIAMTAHRPDSDDGFLLNLSVSLLDYPDTPIHHQDQLHDIDLPLALASYKAHSIEILYAQLGWVLRLPPIFVAHVLLPPISVALGSLATILLLRSIAPKAWISALAFLFAYYCLFGDTHEGYPNYAFVRIFQGKCIMLLVVFPYLTLQTLRFMATGDWITWLRLAVAVIAASGLSGTGLFSAPLLMGVMAVGGLVWSWESLKRLAICCSAAAYPLGVALIVRAEVLEQLEIINGPKIYGHVLQFADSQEHILGEGATLYFHLAAVASVFLLARTSTQQRIFALCVATFLLVVQNPLLRPYWVQFVTPAPVAWRLWWALPFPIVIALSWSFLSGQLARGHRILHPLAVALLLSLFFWIPDRYVLSKKNGVTWQAPSYRVPSESWKVATLVNQVAPKDMPALVPRSIAMWLTTQRGYRQVVGHKTNMLEIFRPYMGDAETDRRVEVFNYISGFSYDEETAPQALERAVSDLKIGAVAFRTRHPDRSRLRRLLDEHGFHQTKTRYFDVWTRGK